MYFVLPLLSLCFIGCAAPDYVNKRPVSEINDLMPMNHNDTILQLNRIASNLISTNAGIESKVVKYMEESVVRTSFDKESILMSVDNAITSVAEQIDYLNSFNASDYDQDKVGNLQLSITEYDTSIQALRSAIQENDEIGLAASLKSLQNAISSLHSASIGM